MTAQSSPRLAYNSDELCAIGQAIVAVQSPHGFIPFGQERNGDPWNHIEAAMALDELGLEEEATCAYEFLFRIQRSDGAFHAAYDHHGVVSDVRLDSNVTAYLATGAYHHALVTRDTSFAKRALCHVDAALDFVLELQQQSGAIAWSRERDGTPGEIALLAAGSSIYSSLLAGAMLAELVGTSRPAWRECAAALAAAVAERPTAFTPKDEFAMDWYYPVLGGVLARASGRRRLHARFTTFVTGDRGVRCRSDGEWVTAAETAECAMACARAGWPTLAFRLLIATRRFYRSDGTFATGVVEPHGTEFPQGERTTYSAAAVVLAESLLSGATAMRALFGLLTDNPVGAVRS